jgi:hypothetical protein
MFDPNAPPPSDRPSEPSYTPPAYTPPPYSPPPAYTPPGYTPPPAPPAYTAPIYATPFDPRAAPQDYRTAGLFLLIAGITTSIVNLIIVVCTIWFCVGACWLPLLAVSVLAIVTGARANGGARIPNIRVVTVLALLASFFSCDLVGITLNILALVWLSKDDVSRWLEARP